MKIRAQESRAEERNTNHPHISSSSRPWSHSSQPTISHISLGWRSDRGGHTLHQLRQRARARACVLVSRAELMDPPGSAFPVLVLGRSTWWAAGCSGQTFGEPLRHTPGHGILKTLKPTTYTQCQHVQEVGQNPHRQFCSPAFFSTSPVTEVALPKLWPTSTSPLW